MGGILFWYDPQIGSCPLTSGFRRPSERGRDGGFNQPVPFRQSLPHSADCYFSSTQKTDDIGSPLLLSAYSPRFLHVSYFNRISQSFDEGSSIKGIVFTPKITSQTAPSTHWPSCIGYFRWSNFRLGSRLHVIFYSLPSWSLGCESS